MSHPNSIPSNYARMLQADLAAGKVNDEQKLRHFERLVDWAVSLEVNSEADEVNALRGEVRRLERQVRELENANAKLKDERNIRKTRRDRGASTIRRLPSEAVAPTTREEQEEKCWEQHDRGDVA